MQHAEQGLAVRAARLARNMTQAHLAAAGGISEKTVRRIESGEAVRAESVRAACAVLGLDASALRSEAELRPEAAEAFDRERTRQSARILAVVASLGTGCFLLPLVALHAPPLKDETVFRAMAAFPLAIVIAFLFAAPRAPRRGERPSPEDVARFRKRLAPITEAATCVAAPLCIGKAALDFHSLLTRPTLNSVPTLAVDALLVGLVLSSVVSILAIGSPWPLREAGPAAWTDAEGDRQAAPGGVAP